MVLSATQKTRRQVFLEEMEQGVPWRELCALIEPHYPKAGNGGHRWEWNVCCVCISCSSGSICRTRRWKRPPYYSPVMRQLVGIDLGQEPAPDETAVCKFRHLLEEHKLGVSRSIS